MEPSLRNLSEPNVSWMEPWLRNLSEPNVSWMEPSLRNLSEPNVSWMEPSLRNLSEPNVSWMEPWLRNLSEPNVSWMEPSLRNRFHSFGTSRNLVQGFGRLPQTTPKLYWKNPKPFRLLGKKKCLILFNVWKKSKMQSLLVTRLSCWASEESADKTGTRAGAVGKNSPMGATAYKFLPLLPYAYDAYDSYVPSVLAIGNISESSPKGVPECLGDWWLTTAHYGSPSPSCLRCRQIFTKVKPRSREVKICQDGSNSVPRLRIWGCTLAVKCQHQEYQPRNGRSNIWQHLKTFHIIPQWLKHGEIGSTR